MVYDLASPARSAAVSRLMRLDLPVQEMSDVLACLAGDLGGHPLTTATALEGTVQHFLATNDGPMDDILSGASYCQYIISTGEFLCLNDASIPESRFSKLKRSLIRGEPLVAYLGFPLNYLGEVVGAVCAVDSRARIWTPEQHYLVYKASVEMAALIAS